MAVPQVPHWAAVSGFGEPQFGQNMFTPISVVEPIVLEAQSFAQAMGHTHPKSAAKMTKPNIKT